MKTIGDHSLTLEPLRTNGAGALDTAGLAGIRKVTLLEIEVAWDNEFQVSIVRKADDLFLCAEAEQGIYDPIPKDGRLVQAVFLVDFVASLEPQVVRIRPPGTLAVGPDCDLPSLESWLRKRGFKKVPTVTLSR
jgi:hypothetical protein